MHGVKDTEFEIHHGDTLDNDWSIFNEMNPAKKIEFDAIVLGAGAAGLMCAAVAGARGRRGRRAGPAHAAAAGARGVGGGQ